MCVRLLDWTIIQRYQKKIIYLNVIDHVCSDNTDEHTKKKRQLFHLIKYRNFPEVFLSEELLGNNVTSSQYRDASIMVSGRSIIFTYPNPTMPWTRTWQMYWKQDESMFYRLSNELNKSRR